jgi:hypothetical protein
MYLYAVFVFVFVIWQFKQLIFDKNVTQMMKMAIFIYIFKVTKNEPK